jgi:hypothetical protein
MPLRPCGGLPVCGTPACACLRACGRRRRAAARTTAARQPVRCRGRPRACACVAVVSRVATHAWLTCACECVCECGELACEASAVRACAGTAGAGAVCCGLWPGGPAVCSPACLLACCCKAAARAHACMRHAVSRHASARACWCGSCCGRHTSAHTRHQPATHAGGVACLLVKVRAAARADFEQVCCVHQESCVWCVQDCVCLTARCRCPWARWQAHTLVALCCRTAGVRVAHSGRQPVAHRSSLLGCRVWVGDVSRCSLRSACVACCNLEHGHVHGGSRINSTHRLLLLPLLLLQPSLPARQPAAAAAAKRRRAATTPHCCCCFSRSSRAAL